MKSDTVRLQLPLILVLWSLALTGVFAASRPIEAERTDTELCVEVRLELNRQVVTGLVTQEEADQISRRCFDLFVK